MTNKETTESGSFTRVWWRAVLVVGSGRNVRGIETKERRREEVMNLLVYTERKSVMWSVILGPNRGVKEAMPRSLRARSTTSAF